MSLVLEDEGQLTITINQANDRPVAQPYTIIKDYDAAGFTIGTASTDHPLVAGNISDADSSSFTFSGIHENTSSNITLANAKQEITIADFGTITVNANDELVFTPDDALANLPENQTISRSFIYFVSDDGGAYNANEAGTSVDRTDRITITINGLPTSRSLRSAMSRVFILRIIIVPPKVEKPLYTIFEHDRQL